MVKKSKKKLIKITNNKKKNTVRNRSKKQKSKGGQLDPRFQGFQYPFNHRGYDFSRRDYQLRQQPQVQQVVQQEQLPKSVIANVISQLDLDENLQLFGKYMRELLILLNKDPQLPTKLKTKFDKYLEMHGPLQIDTSLSLENNTSDNQRNNQRNRQNRRRNRSRRKRGNSNRRPRNNTTSSNQQQHQQNLDNCDLEKLEDDSNNYVSSLNETELDEYHNEDITDIKPNMILSGRYNEQYPFIVKTIPKKSDPSKPCDYGLLLQHTDKLNEYLDSQRAGDDSSNLLNEFVPNESNANVYIELSKFKPFIKNFEDRPVKTYPFSASQIFALQNLITNKTPSMGYRPGFELKPLILYFGILVNLLPKVSIWEITGDLTDTRSASEYRPIVCCLHPTEPNKILYVLWSDELFTPGLQVDNLDTYDDEAKNFFVFDTGFTFDLSKLQNFNERVLDFFYDKIQELSGAGN